MCRHSTVALACVVKQPHPLFGIRGQLIPSSLLPSLSFSHLTVSTWLFLTARWSGVAPFTSSEGTPSSALLAKICCSPSLLPSSEALCAGRPRRAYCGNRSAKASFVETLNCFLPREFKRLYSASAIAQRQTWELKLMGVVPSACHARKQGQRLQYS